jgi:hypothetical protein
MSVIGTPGVGYGIAPALASWGTPNSANPKTEADSSTDDFIDVLPEANLTNNALRPVKSKSYAKIHSRAISTCY